MKDYPAYKENSRVRREKACYFYSPRVDSGWTIAQSISHGTTSVDMHTSASGVITPKDIDAFTASLLSSGYQVYTDPLISESGVILYRKKSFSVVVDVQPSARESITLMTLTPYVPASSSAAK